MKSLNSEQIQQIIPHRPPFLLIDEVLELQPGVHVVAKKTVTDQEFWIPGHFPGQPVQPGVLTVEMLAQAGTVCVLSLPENKGKLAFFGGIDGARFRRPVRPGDTVLLEVSILKLRARMGTGKAIATVEGEKAVTAEILFALGEALQ